MHIPDGYLSPATCAVGYIVAAPFWYGALKRVKRMLQSRLVPLLAVISAFCFVVMMFNLPIPGGTTAHAVGMGIGAIILGPWASSLAISIALMIQGLFFGDGGITAFGFNCVNMAIVGSFVSYFVYRLIAGRTPITSHRRVVAAAIAGYVAINCSAFLTALEFGIQPVLFHDATGAPLYAPYAFSVALPAMMFAHLTVAGAAEAIIAGGIVAYLQRANPSLLETTAISGRRLATETGKLAAAGGWLGTRNMWVGLGVLMVLSPLGLIAAGMAWGEWGTSDLQDPSVRLEIAHASGDIAPPSQVPSGMQRLANAWNAPLPAYAPAFIHNKNVGYAASAVIGGGLIILVFSGLSWIFGRHTATPDAASRDRPTRIDGDTKTVGDDD